MFLDKFCLKIWPIICLFALSLSSSGLTQESPTVLQSVYTKYQLTEITTLKNRNNFEEIYGVSWHDATTKQLNEYYHKYVQRAKIKEQQALQRKMTEKVREQTSLQRTLIKKEQKVMRKNLEEARKVNTKAQKNRMSRSSLSQKMRSIQRPGSNKASGARKNFSTQHAD